MKLKVDFSDDGSFDNFSEAKLDYLGVPIKYKVESTSTCQIVHIANLSEISVVDLEGYVRSNRVDYLQIPYYQYYLDFAKYLSKKGLKFFFSGLEYDSDSSIDFLEGSISDFYGNYNCKVIVELFHDYVESWSIDFVIEKFYEARELLSKDYIFTSVSQSFFSSKVFDKNLSLNGFNILVARDIEKTRDYSMSDKDMKRILNKLIT